MRQVRDDELTYIIQSALSRVSKSAVKAMTDFRPAERLRGRLIAASVVTDAMKRMEILSSGSEPPPFRYADLGEGSGIVLDAIGPDDTPVS